MRSMTSLCMENIAAELQFAVAAISRAVILGRGSAIAPDLARLLEAAAGTLDLVGRGSPAGPTKSEVVCEADLVGTWATRAEDLEETGE